MDWLSDEAIEQFLVTPLFRVETTEIFQASVGKAWVVLDAEHRKYLGTVTRSGKGYYAFTCDDHTGSRVSSFDTAVQIIELATSSDWVEEPRSYRRYHRDGVTLPEES